MRNIFDMPKGSTIKLVLVFVFSSDFLRFYDIIIKSRLTPDLRASYRQKRAEGVVKMKMPASAIETIMFAPCGMNCMACYKHCYHKKPCGGCLKSDTGKPEHCRKCRIKDCIKERDLIYCYECVEYPCKRIKSLEKAIIRAMGQAF